MNCGCKDESECVFKKRGHSFQICRGTAVSATGEPITAEQSQKFRDLWSAMDRGDPLPAAQPETPEESAKRKSLCEKNRKRAPRANKQPAPLGMGDHLADIIDSSYMLKAAVSVSDLLGKWFRSAPKKTCRCNTRVAQLNQFGPDWAEKHIDDIVGWLRDGHAANQIAIPFSETVAKVWIEEAIRRARE